MSSWTSSWSVCNRQGKSDTYKCILVYYHVFLTSIWKAALFFVFLFFLLVRLSLWNKLRFFHARGTLNCSGRLMWITLISHSHNGMLVLLPVWNLPVPLGEERHYENKVSYSWHTDFNGLNPGLLDLKSTTLNSTLPGFQHNTPF